MQLTYPRENPVALAGQKADSRTCEVVSYPAFEDIPAGRAVVFKSDGTVELPKATTLTKVVGVAMYSPMKEQNASGVALYKAGEMVPVMRKGAIWAQYDGGSQSELGPINVKHASTDGSGNAQHRGKFTNTGTSATAGAEISAAPEGVLTAKTGSATLVCVELNLPA